MNKFKYRWVYPKEGIKLYFAFLYIFRFVIVFCLCFSYILLFYLLICLLDILYLYILNSYELMISSYVIKCEPNSSDAIQIWRNAIIQIKFNINTIDESNNNLDINPILSCKDRSKRKIFWVMWERYNDRYSSYKEFKDYWDPNTKIREAIKGDIKESIKKIKVQKETIHWLLSPGKRRKDRENRRKCYRV